MLKKQEIIFQVNIYKKNLEKCQIQIMNQRSLRLPVSNIS